MYKTIKILITFLAITLTILGCGGSDKSTGSDNQNIINGICGSADGKTYPSSVISYNPDIQCTSGVTNNSDFPNIGQTLSWTCAGSGGGSNASCSATRSNTSPVVNSISPTSIQSNENTSFTLSGSNLPPTIALAINGEFCFSTDSAPDMSIQPTPAMTCRFTFDANLSEVDLRVIDSSSGELFNTFTLNVPQIPDAVNGICGSANNKNYNDLIDNYGSDTQCSSGTSSNTDFPVSGGSETWVCRGINGGSNSSSCSASRQRQILQSILWLETQQKQEHGKYIESINTAKSIFTTSNNDHFKELVIGDNVILNGPLGNSYFYEITDIETSDNIISISGVAVINDFQYPISISINTVKNTYIGSASAPVNRRLSFFSKKTNGIWYGFVTEIDQVEFKEVELDFIPLID